jgi:hypothetical protein
MAKDLPAAQVADAAPVSDLCNLGPRTVDMLATIGISNVGELKEVGYLDTYLSMKARYPRNINRMWLYALFSALNDKSCIRLSIDEKAVLEAQMQARIAEVEAKKHGS